MAKPHCERKKKTGMGGFKKVHCEKTKRANIRNFKYEKEDEATNYLIDTIIDPLNNLMLNLCGGLLPENLTETEVELLKKAYGDDWFAELGYTEPEYKMPTF